MENVYDGLDRLIEIICLLFKNSCKREQYGVWHQIQEVDWQLLRTMVVLELK